jgi:hypothetical protein
VSTTQNRSMRHLKVEVIFEGFAGALEQHDGAPAGCSLGQRELSVRVHVVVFFLFSLFFFFGFSIQIIIRYGGEASRWGGHRTTAAGKEEGGGRCTRVSRK